MCIFKSKVNGETSITGISEETKHDADLAIAFAKEIHRWTDLYAVQYKGNKLLQISFFEISKVEMVRKYLL